MTLWWMTWWAPQAARIDAISLRERILLFITVLASVGAIANWAWLTPAQDAHRQLTVQLDQQALALQKARADLAAVALPVATDDTVRSELAGVRSQLADARGTLADMASASGTRATPLTQLLVQLLHRQDGLTLIRAATISAAPIVQPAPAQGGTAVAPLPGGLVRQGVELTVTGPYAELTKYVQALEQALPRIRWGTMSLRSEKQPPELTLQLYLVEAKTP